MATDLSPSDIRRSRAENPRLRDRDLADQLGVSEAALVAAHAGETSTRIDPAPDRLIPAIATLGEVMALTRNESCVSEKTGSYGNWHPGPHAGAVLNEAIDLRVFPAHWVHAFAIEHPTPQGMRRTLQVFDAAGDSVHKVFLRDEAKAAAWAAAVAALRLDDQSQTTAVEPRRPPETPKADPARLEALRREWAAMTDTHQFLRLTARLKMNRLGAYRIVGAPFARPLAQAAIARLMDQVRDRGLEAMVFVGNRGCIQIHSGPFHRVEPMGPWLNVLDPGFNLHLRGDHIAEVWAVSKPTRRGAALSVEAFDRDGGLILQVFGVGKEGRDCRPAWGELVAGLPEPEPADLRA